MAQTSYGTITISDMTDGASVVSTQQIYWLKTNSTAVVKRVDGTVLPGDNDITNGWTTIIPTYVIDGTYYVSTATVLNHGVSPVYSEPVVDHVLTENSYNAAEAIRKANEQELIINGLQSKIKYIWTNLNAQDYAVGTYAASGIDQVELVYGNANTYGFNSYLGHQDLRFGYNNIPLTTIGLEGLKLYSPLFTNNVITGSQVGIKLDRDGLYFYRPGTQTIDAQLDNNGLILRRGGVIGGDRATNNFIYLSTQDFPLRQYQLTTDTVVDNDKIYYELNNHNYVKIESPDVSDLSNYYELIEPGITINGYTPSKTDLNVYQENDDIAWRQVIGSKFGVDAEGNLYASNAHIEGTINATYGVIGDCLIENGKLTIGQAYIDNSSTLNQKVNDINNITDTYGMIFTTLNNNIGLDNLFYYTNGDGENPTIDALSKEHFQFNEFELMKVIPLYGEYIIACTIQPENITISNTDVSNVIEINTSTFISKINREAGRYIFGWIRNGENSYSYTINSEPINLLEYGITITGDSSALEQLQTGDNCIIDYPVYNLALKQNEEEDTSYRIIDNTILNCKGQIPIIQEIIDPPKVETTTIINIIYNTAESLYSLYQSNENNITNIQTTVNQQQNALSEIEQELQPYRGYIEFTNYPSIVVGKGNINNYVEILPDRVSIYSSVNDIFKITLDTVAETNKNYYVYSNGRFILTFFSPGADITESTLGYEVYELDTNSATILNETTYMSGDRMYSTNTVCSNLYMQTIDPKTQQRVGNLGWVMRTNGHLSLKKIG